jgi:TetR/AcrR family transcriptional regulator
VPLTATRPSRGLNKRGVDTRRDLLEAALVEFAAVGFEAASTRVIAARAGVKQGQLTYHYETKDDLWRATVDHLFERFDAEFATASAFLSSTEVEGAAGAAELVVRALVRAVSRLPELNRVMIHAATTDSDRLAWLVDRHVRPRFDELSPLWEQVRTEGGTHLDADPLLIYYCLLGSASLLYVNAAEAAHLLGVSDSTQVLTDALVESHADTIAAMLLGPRPKPRRTRTQLKGQ